jgi:hypothetical protein
MLHMQPASTKKSKTTPAPSVHTRASPKGNQTTVSQYRFTPLYVNRFLVSNSSCVAQAQKPTTAHVRQKTLGLKSVDARPLRRSSRLLATFKELDPNKEIPIVDLTSDAGQPATAPVVFNREPARACGVFIREPARNATRVVVPTVEKGMQRVEAKNKGKRPIWQA